VHSLDLAGIPASWLVGSAPQPPDPRLQQRSNSGGVAVQSIIHHTQPAGIIAADRDRDRDGYDQACLSTDNRATYRWQHATINTASAIALRGLAGRRTGSRCQEQLQQLR